MLSTAYYFLQVFFCSAVLMGYYWLVLRDKKFHQYNRFYLISVLLMSWIIPLIKIQWTKPVTTDAQVINFLSIVADNNAEIDANLAKTSYQFLQKCRRCIPHSHPSKGDALFILSIYFLA